MASRFGRERVSPMQVKINGKKVEVFAGARVQDALRKYSPAEWKLVRDRARKVCDKYGNEVALDGELSGGEELVTTAAGPRS